MRWQACFQATSELTQAFVTLYPLTRNSCLPKLWENPASLSALKQANSFSEAFPSRAGIQVWISLYYQALKFYISFHPGHKAFQPISNSTPKVFRGGFLPSCAREHAVSAACLRTSSTEASTPQSLKPPTLCFALPGQLFGVLQAKRSYSCVHQTQRIESRLHT